MSVTSNKSRCLIISCSQSKNTASHPLSAIERYTGPSFRVLGKFLREQPREFDDLTVYILSAHYGLIRAHTPISYYDQKMTASNARAMRQDVLNTIRREILPTKYVEIFVSMGQTYLLALDGLSTMVNENTKLIISRGSAGRKLTELRDWLWGCPPAKSQKSTSLVTPNLDKQTAVLRGRSITMTTADVVNQLHALIEADHRSANRIQSWYVDVDGKRLSPKWTAQMLFDVPVHEFSADEARRVLRRLGLNCYRI